MEKHVCKHCSRPIEKRSYESSNRFRSRKYCSQECPKAYMKKHKIGWFSGGKTKKKKLEDNYDEPSFSWMAGKDDVYGNHRQKETDR